MSDSTSHLRFSTSAFVSLQTHLVSLCAASLSNHEKMRQLAAFISRLPSVADEQQIDAENMHGALMKFNEWIDHVLFGQLSTKDSVYRLAAVLLISKMSSTCLRHFHEFFSVHRLQQHLPTTWASNDPTLLGTLQGFVYLFKYAKFSELDLQERCGVLRRSLVSSFLSAADSAEAAPSVSCVPILDVQVTLARAFKDFPSCLPDDSAFRNNVLLRWLALYPVSSWKNKRDREDVELFVSSIEKGWRENTQEIVEALITVVAFLVGAPIALPEKKEEQIDGSSIDKTGSAMEISVNPSPDSSASTTHVPIECSPAVSVLFEHAPFAFLEETLQKASSTLLTIEDSAFKKCLMKLIQWPLTAGISRWILAVIDGLCHGRRYTLIADVASSGLALIVAQLFDEQYRVGALQLIKKLLLGYQHQCDTYHQVIPKFINLMKLFESNSNTNKSESNSARDTAAGTAPGVSLLQLSQPDEEFLREFSTMNYALMFQFSGYPDLYLPLVDFFKRAKCSQPNELELRKILHQNNWMKDANAVERILVAGTTSGKAAGLSPARHSSGKAGIINIGNSCYSSSVLQSLLLTDALRQTVLSASFPMTSAVAVKEFGTVKSLQNFFAFMIAGNRPAVRPTSLLQTLPQAFRSGLTQQDAGEFAKHMVEAIGTALKKNEMLKQAKGKNGAEEERSSNNGANAAGGDSDSAGNDNEPERAEKKAKVEKKESDTPTLSPSSLSAWSEMDEMFGGVEMSRVECSTCLTKSDRFEAFVELPLALNLNHGADISIPSKAAADQSPPVQSSQTLSSNSTPSASSSLSSSPMVIDSTATDIGLAQSNVAANSAQADKDESMSAQRSDMDVELPKATPAIGVEQSIVHPTASNSSEATSNTSSSQASAPTEAQRLQLQQLLLFAVMNAANAASEQSALLSAAQQTSLTTKAVKNERSNELLSNVSGNGNSELLVSSSSPSLISTQVSSSSPTLSVPVVTSMSNMSNHVQHNVNAQTLPSPSPSLPLSLLSSANDSASSVASEQPSSSSMATLAVANALIQLASAAAASAAVRSSNSLHLPALLASHMSAEILDGDNRYMCSKCCSKQPAKKAIHIVTPPKHLFICLKRYQHDYATGIRRKIMTEVSVPVLLQLPITHVEEKSNTAQDDADSQRYPFAMYILYSVVIHSGASTQSGHYYALGRNTNAALAAVAEHRSSLYDIYARRADPTVDAEEKDVLDHAVQQFELTAAQSSWYSFNDTRVKTAQFQDIAGNSKSFPNDVPYLLFYTRIPPPVSSAARDNLSHNDSESVSASSTSDNLSTVLRRMVEMDNSKYLQEQSSALANAIALSSMYDREYAKFRGQPSSNQEYTDPDM